MAKKTARRKGRTAGRKTAQKPATGTRNAKRRGPRPAGKAAKGLKSGFTDLNALLNRVRRLFGMPYWSLSALLKRKVKRAVEFVSNFEDAIVREAMLHGADGVICGHVHTPQMRHIGGIHYCNDGDWVESCTALVEHFDGRLEIIDWPSLQLTLGISSLGEEAPISEAAAEPLDRAEAGLLSRSDQA